MRPLATLGIFFCLAACGGSAPPQPSITSLSPSSAAAGGAAFTLTVNGSGFISSSVLQWNGSNRATTFVSNMQLSASIPASDIGTGGPAQVAVFNPASGGGTSNTVTFTVNNPVPTVTSLSPSSTGAGGAAFTLTVNGSGFISSSVLQWNGSNRATTFVSNTQLTAAIPAADIATTGTAQVTVFNPGPVGGTSNALPVAINNPVPSIASVSPAVVTPGGPAFTLTVTGSNFNSRSVVRWIGSDRSTTFVGASQLTAAIPSTDVVSLGPALVTVFNPAPGGGTSNPAVVDVGNPVPTITLIAPPIVPPGGILFALEVVGTNFLSTSVVQWNGSNRPTTLINRTQLTAAIPASDIVAAGSAQVTVFNPTTPPIGGSSNSSAITIAPIGVVERVSVASDGTQSNGDSGGPSISADGRFVAFTSAASNLVPGGTSGASDVYLRDTCLGASAGCAPSTIRVSVDSNGTAGNKSSDASSSISANGRFVAFASLADNLILGDTNSALDVFVRDTCFGAPASCVPSTVRVSVATDGTQGNGDSFNPSISADGRFVAFTSAASNLIPAGTNNPIDAFVRDTCVGAPAGCTPSTILASVANDGSQIGTPFGNGSGGVSADGRFVLFFSRVPGNIRAGIYYIQYILVRDTCVGAPSCRPSTINSLLNAGGPSFAADGRFASFITSGGVFVWDSCIGAPAGCAPAFAQVDVAIDGTPANAGAGFTTINADGRFIAFDSPAGNLVPDTSIAQERAFVRDTCFGAPAGCQPLTVRVSVASDGTPGTGHSFDPAISADGRFAAFVSSSSNLLPGAANSVLDVFLARTGFNPVSPVPGLTSLSSSSATAGTASFTLKATGSAFVPGSVVLWNGSARTTFYISGTELESVIPPSDIATAGAALVTVFNPSPGGGTSNALTFTITP